ncbi:FUSC family protein [Romboutsia ilealis]|uniref:FUSC family protein n=1 Tax=Romboutsia ilealis TaxID=1115758 RepID=UPI002572AE0F|nr:FUSC family protein [Romboutsia ilealis]
MIKKTIITNTIIFMVVMFFVITFKSIFGNENTLIGVTTITATLMFLERDFTGAPLKNILKFIGVNLLIGLGASLIVVSNIWLGLIINFIVVFIFSYIFTYNLRQPLYVPFGLQYIFLLATPVSTDRLWIRLLALISGALIIMLVQLLINRNKLDTHGNKILIGICESIENKIDYIKDKSDNYDSISSISSSIDEFRTIIYDKRELDYYLTKEAKIKLNMSVALEGINTVLYSVNNKFINLTILDTLEALLKVAKEVISINPKKDKIIQLNSYDMKKLLDYCQEQEINDLLNLQLLEGMIYLDDTLKELTKLDREQYKAINKIGKEVDVSSDKNINYLFKITDSPKYCYAIRMAITMTIGLFLIEYFKLSEGRWILFTILSLTTPLYETSKHKIRYRIEATLIGAIIITMLFSIFKSEDSRLLIVMLSGYLQGYVNEYKHKTIFVTISAIGSAAIVGNIQALTIGRIIMVVIGALVAIIANKYLFPYNLDKSNYQLRRIYDVSIKKMFKELCNLVEGKNNPEVIKNLFVTTSIIESKARINEQIDKDKNYISIVNERRCLVSNIYELYMWIYRENINSKDRDKIINYIKLLIEYRHDDKTDKVTLVKKGINESDNIKTKIIISTILVILEELDRLSELVKLSE